MGQIITRNSTLTGSTVESFLVNGTFVNPAPLGGKTVQVILVGPAPTGDTAGSGGAGGASNVAGPGFAGGAGAIGAGGGGGGSSLSTFASGAGGNGGPGAAYIIVY